MTSPVPLYAWNSGCEPDDLVPCGPKPFRSLYAPMYSFNHPAVQRVKLGAVKTQLFNPCVPSWKRYEMDTVCGKPPEEHSQSTSTLCLGQSHYNLPLVRLSVCLSVTFGLCQNG